MNWDDRHAIHRIRDVLTKLKLEESTRSGLSYEQIMKSMTNIMMNTGKPTEMYMPSGVMKTLLEAFGDEED